MMPYMQQKQQLKNGIVPGGGAALLYARESINVIII